MSKDTSKNDKSKNAFLAIAVAAAWFYIYIMAHEGITAWVIQDSHVHRGKLILNLVTYNDLTSKEALDELKTIYSAGAKEFGKCLICHAEDPEAKSFGPPLSEFFGEAVARLQSENKSDYRYSAVLLEMHKRGMTWTVESLWAYVHRPRTFAKSKKHANRPTPINQKSRMPIPGLAPIASGLDEGNKSDADGDVYQHTRMPFPGLGPNSLKPADKRKAYRNIKNLIHYLAWSCKEDCKAPKFVELNLEELATLNWKDYWKNPRKTACMRSKQRAYTATDLRLSRNVFLVPENTAICDDPQPASPAVWTTRLSDFIEQTRERFCTKLCGLGLLGGQTES